MCDEDARGAAEGAVRMRAPPHVVGGVVGVGDENLQATRGATVERVKLHGHGDGDVPRLGAVDAEREEARPGGVGGGELGEARDKDPPRALVDRDGEGGLVCRRRGHGNVEAAHAVHLHLRGTPLAQLGAVELEARGLAQGRVHEGLVEVVRGLGREGGEGHVDGSPQWHDRHVRGVALGVEHRVEVDGGAYGHALLARQAQGQERGPRGRGGDDGDGGGVRGEHGHAVGAGRAVGGVLGAHGHLVLRVVARVALPLVLRAARLRPVRGHEDVHVRVPRLGLDGHGQVPRAIGQGNLEVAVLAPDERLLERQSVHEADGAQRVRRRGDGDGAVLGEGVHAHVVGAARAEVGVIREDAHLADAPRALGVRSRGHPLEARGGRVRLHC
mmetsp:Transcript_29478/g.79196  ORF Transcript_29478/g.79196 Transcript_29478/m.79196 type:complete len:386 (+) Transcript_29478:1665-2822(+)